MFATNILGTSIILQFLAAGLALNMIYVTGRRRAWIFIAAALTLMGVRRAITFTDTVLAGKGERVVVVKDDENVREVTVEMLSRLGYDVLDAGDGKDLEAMLEKDGHHIDLVLSDIVLANGSSGVEIAKIATGRDPTTRILFMAGYAEHDVVSGGATIDGTR
jgi:CheY-like chemotaxis protein